MVLRFKEENPHWGYTRIRDYIVHLGCKIGETTVKNILVENGYPGNNGGNVPLIFSIMGVVASALYRTKDADVSVSTPLTLL